MGLGTAQSSPAIEFQRLRDAAAQEYPGKEYRGNSEVPKDRSIVLAIAFIEQRSNVDSLYEEDCVIARKSLRPLVTLFHTVFEQPTQQCDDWSWVMEKIDNLGATSRLIESNDKTKGRVEPGRTAFAKTCW